MNDQENVFRHFYRTARAGTVRLSDGGGPFGFDIGLAVIIDELLSSYRCDALIETGCFLGDTTNYLAAAYPDLPVFTCDIEYRYAMFTRHRTRHLDDVTVIWQDSAKLVEEICAVYNRPLCFLDAHWGPQ